MNEMNNQPAALRLADWLEANSAGIYRPAADAASELRRLHDENQDLRTRHYCNTAEIESLQNRVQELGEMARENRSKRVIELEQRIAEMEEQMAAIGAGGVEPLRKRAEQSAVLRTSTEQPVALQNEPVAYLWQHTITGQTKALMHSDVFTAGPHWRLVGPLFLATESGQAVHMATASVPVAATHWRKAQALPELTAHQPPAVNDSLTTESTVNRKVTVQVPPFTTIAQHKLDDLFAQGFRITGYAIERADVTDWAPQRGFVTHCGLVGWWTPHQIDRIPGAQHGQPT